MAAETITQQILYNAVYNFVPFEDIFDLKETTYILVQRPQMSFNRCRSFSKASSRTSVDSSKTTPDGSFINFPPFPTVPPIEMLPDIMKSPLLEHETLSDLHPDKWLEVLGHLTSSNIEVTHNPTIPTPGYIKKARYSSSIEKLLTHLEESGEKDNIYAVYAAMPGIGKKSKKLLFMKFTLVEEFTYKKKAEIWSPKTSRYSVATPTYYATVHNELFFASTSVLKVKEWVFERDALNRASPHDS